MKKIKNEELGRLSVPGYKEAEKAPVIIVLDNIRSLNNVGSVFRTSDAFRVKEILLCGFTGTPPHREIQKTALGATESVEWKFFDSTPLAIAYLRSKEFEVIAVEQVEESKPLQKFIPEKKKRYAFVFGNEIKGVSPEILDDVDMCLEIPQFGTKHSFNVSITAGMILWHYFFLTRED